MRKFDLFASTSAYALGVGLNHYAVAKQREHMNELIERAKNGKP